MFFEDFFPMTLCVTKLSNWNPWIFPSCEFVNNSYGIQNASQDVTRLGNNAIPSRSFVKNNCLIFASFGTASVDFAAFFLRMKRVGYLLWSGSRPVLHLTDAARRWTSSSFRSDIFRANWLRNQEILRPFRCADKIIHTVHDGHLWILYPLSAIISVLLRQN